MAPSLTSHTDRAGRILVPIKYMNPTRPIPPNTMNISHRSGNTGGGTLNRPRWYISPALNAPTNILIWNNKLPMSIDIPARAGPQAVFLIGFQTRIQNGIKKINITFSQKIHEYDSNIRYLKIFCSNSMRPYQSVIKKANRWYVQSRVRPICILLADQKTEIPKYFSYPPHFLMANAITKIILSADWNPVTVYRGGRIESFHPGIKLIAKSLTIKKCTNTTIMKYNPPKSARLIF